MLIESICQSEELGDFHCYITYRKPNIKKDSLRGVFEVRIINKLTREQMIYIKELFKKVHINYLYKKHCFIFNCDPINFINQEFHVIYSHENYHSLNGNEDLEIIDILSDKKILDDNCIYIAERSYGLIYYIQITHETNSIILPYLEQKRAEKQIN